MAEPVSVSSMAAKKFGMEDGELLDRMLARLALCEILSLSSCSLVPALFAKRFLLVAVIAVAVSESKKNKQIWNLKKSVELRDQELSSMQQKLDDLCEKLDSTKELSTCYNFSDSCRFSDLIILNSGDYGGATPQDGA
ncbi:hypothetical protein DS421_20g693560 [Arachis hypogaea]|nr:hypothetical protein DS421_20g693560 [Arachis hypogaea]